MNEPEPYSKNEVYEYLIGQTKENAHPERYILGKPHPDRAKQFKPFAALRGYEELIAKSMEERNALKDFSKLEEGC